MWSRRRGERRRQTTVTETVEDKSNLSKTGDGLMRIKGKKEKRKYVEGGKIAGRRELSILLL